MWAIGFRLLSFLMGVGAIFKVVAQVVFYGFLALPTWAKTLVLVAVALLIVYYVGERNGADRIQRKWDAAVATAVQNATNIGNKANADAEKRIPALTPNDLAADRALPTHAEPCRVRDHFDRSCP